MHRRVRVLCPGCPERPWLPTRGHLESQFGHETVGHRGRVRVTLFVGHPYANSGGWQWRYRLLVMCALHHVLRADEHVDHLGDGPDDDRIEVLRVVLAEYHGRDHATATELAGLNRRGPDGRFIEHGEPLATEKAHRNAAIITALAR